MTLAGLVHHPAEGLRFPGGLRRKRLWDRLLPPLCPRASTGFFRGTMVL